MVIELTKKDLKIFKEILNGNSDLKNLLTNYFTNVSLLERNLTNNQEISFYRIKKDTQYLVQYLNSLCERNIDNSQKEILILFMDYFVHIYDLIGVVKSKSISLCDFRKLFYYDVVKPKFSVLNLFRKSEKVLRAAAAAVLVALVLGIASPVFAGDKKVFSDSDFTTIEVPSEGGDFNFTSLDNSDDISHKTIVPKSVQTTGWILDATLNSNVYDRNIKTSLMNLIKDDIKSFDADVGFGSGNRIRAIFKGKEAAGYLNSYSDISFKARDLFESDLSKFQGKHLNILLDFDVLNLAEDALDEDISSYVQTIKNLNIQSISLVEVRGLDDDMSYNLKLFERICQEAGIEFKFTILQNSSDLQKAVSALTSF